MDHHSDSLDHMQKDVNRKYRRKPDPTDRGKEVSEHPSKALALVALIYIDFIMQSFALRISKTLYAWDTLPVSEVDYFQVIL